jgi:hypothetical protein
MHHFGVTLAAPAPRLQRNEPGTHHLHLRPGTNAVLLVAGDKAGHWTAWYRQAIPLAEERYAAYLKERTQP